MKIPWSKRWEKEFGRLPLMPLKSDSNQIDNTTCSRLADRSRPGIELNPLLIDTWAKVVRLRGVSGYIRRFFRSLPLLSAARLLSCRKPSRVCPSPSIGKPSGRPRLVARLLMHGTNYRERERDRAWLVNILVLENFAEFNADQIEA